MRYKVGDIVSVRPDLGVNKEYGTFLFTKEMEKFRGQQVHIAGVDGSEPRCYTIAEDEDFWNFSDEMFVEERNLFPCDENEVDEPTDVPEEVEEVEEFVEQPSDNKTLIIIHVGRKLSNKSGRAYVEELQKYLGDHYKILVLDSGIKSYQVVDTVSI